MKRSRPNATEISPLRRALLAAAREFNSGRYFEAHERLEEALDGVPDDQWDLLLGLIQIAVGYHKAAHGLGGAAKMLDLGLAKVSPYSADAAGLDLELLRERVRADIGRFRATTPDTASLRSDPPRLRPLRRRH